MSGLRSPLPILFESRSQLLSPSAAPSVLISLRSNDYFEDAKSRHFSIAEGENARENAKFTGNAIKIASKTNLRGYHNQRG
jgi:hypothetical protein